MTPARAARREDDAKAGLPLERFCGEIESVSPAEINVREQNIHGLVREDHLGLLSAGRGQHCKSCVLKSLRRDGAEDQFILHHEDAPAAGIREFAPILRLSAPERRDGDHVARPFFAGSPG